MLPSKSSPMPVFVVFTQAVLTLISLFLTLTFELSFRGLCLFVIFDIALCLFLICLKQRRIFTVFFCFMSFLALFHFGQLVLSLFHGQVDTSISYDLVAIYGESRVASVTAFCLLGYNLIALFGLLALRPTESAPGAAPPTGTEEALSTVYSFGKILFIVLILPITLYDIRMCLAAAQMGYAAKYEANSSLLSALDLYFPAAILCMMVGSKSRGATCRGLFLYVLIRSLILLLLVGNRGPLVISLILYIYARHRFIKPYGRKQWPLVVAGCVGLTVLMPFVAYIRGGSSSLGFWEFLSLHNPVSQLLSEFGSTLVTPILAFGYTESFGFLEGNSYLGALSILFPFSNTIFGSVKEFMSVGALLNPYSPSGGALGGSLFAEMYINFGWYSLLLTPLFGAVIARLSSRLQDQSAYQKPFQTAMLIYICYGIFLYVRGGLTDVVLVGKRAIYLWILFALFRWIRGQRTSRSQPVQSLRAHRNVRDSSTERPV